MDISKLMEERNLLKLEVAKKMGIKPQYFARLLINPTEASIRKIAKALGVEVWELFVSHQDALKKISEDNIHKCPHCGKPININVRLDLALAENSEEENFKN